MMTMSENFYSSKNMSSLYKINDRVVHQDSYGDVQSSSNGHSELLTKRGFKPSDMFDPKKKEFLTNLSYKLFPVSWVVGPSPGLQYTVTLESLLLTSTACPGGGAAGAFYVFLSLPKKKKSNIKYKLFLK